MIWIPSDPVSAARGTPRSIIRASPALCALPASVKRALDKLGEDLSAARRRRRIPMALMAERAFITRKTLGMASAFEHADLAAAVR